MDFQHVKASDKAVPTVWFVVGDPLPLSPVDAALKQHLISVGVRVLLMRDAEFAVQKSTRLWPTVSAAVISGSCRDSFWTDAAVLGSHPASSSMATSRGPGPALPLLLLHRSSLVQLGLGRGPQWVRGGAVRLANASHPIAAGLRRGHVPIYEHPARILVVAESCAALVIAHTPVQPAGGQPAGGQPAVFAYESGAPLCNSVPAPARRAVLGLSPESFAGELSVQASGMLGSALLWLIGAPASELRILSRAMYSRAAARVDSPEALAEFRSYAQLRQARWQ